MKVEKSKESNQMNLFNRFIFFNFKLKHKIIYFLICYIIITAFWGYHYYQNVKYVTNESITTNLDSTWHVLEELNNDLSKYNNKKITNQEFNDVISESDPLWMNTECTFNYRFIRKRLQYVDIRELGYYIDALTSTKLSDDELEYHKKNLQKIYELSNKVDIYTENYFQPSAELKETLKEINDCSEKGRKELHKSSE